MSAILLSIAIMAVPPARAGTEDKPGGPNIEGKWLIVYVEEGGKRNATWEQQVATVKGDTMSYSKEGDDRSLRLSFGADQTVKVTATGGKDAEKKSVEMSGVYIAAQDYVCLSLNPAGIKAPAAGEATKGSSAAFIIILRKQR
jgi:hypothetical protein